MLKRFLFIISFSFLFFFFPNLASADNEFIVDSVVTYQVSENGTTTVNHNIILENAVSELYATSYSLELSNMTPKNIKASQGNHNFSIVETKEGDRTKITVSFDDAMVGKGKVRNFDISFEEESFAVRTGEIWEISIPRLSGSNFRNYSANLNVPLSFGEEAYVSPEPDSKEITEGRRIYTYSKIDSQELGIMAGFGEFQVFSFTLNYHLENPLGKTAETEIAIPPDTAYQKLYYQVIDPLPKTVAVDPDGNWLALYSLEPRQRLDISVKGSVQIFAGARPFLKYPEEVLSDNLKGSEFWQTSDPLITSLAQRLKTPFDIYDFVTGNLSYDFERVRPNSERMGAKRALENPDASICMEYTDTFVAIARAAGIPAREINGYAYTENPEIQPLSLVSDVLHAWPEYWDQKEKIWKPIDPTWASTTGGVDYFNKLDLRHFTFVIHGSSASRPYAPGSYKLGPNPQKDVFVNFGQLPDKKTSKPEIFASLSGSFSLTGKKMHVKVKNPGPVAIYNTNLEVLFDDVLNTKKAIDIFPPYSEIEYDVFVPFGILGQKTPEEITVAILGESTIVPTNKNQILLYNLALILIIFTLILASAILAIKRINPLAKIALLIKNLTTKLNAKFNQIRNKGKAA